jgi:hypothetical protein
MRHPASEKLEIIRLVEQSHLPVRRSWRSSASLAATFYRWCDLYQTGGPEALENRSPRPERVWNPIPDNVRGQIVQLALDEPELSHGRWPRASWIQKAMESTRPLSYDASRGYFKTFLLERFCMAEVTIERIQGSAENPLLNVVFMHGLGGDARKTWFYKQGKAGNRFWPGWFRGPGSVKLETETKSCFWPEWLAQDRPGFAIYLVGYPADKMGWNTGWAIELGAVALLDRLLEKAHRYAVENHIHRNPRLGLSVMNNETWYYRRHCARLQQYAGCSYRQP